MNLSGYRDQFPITQDTVYLNHAAVSPLSKRVIDAIQTLLERRSRGQVEVNEYIVKTREHLRENIGRLIGCRAEQIAIISNTSEGFNWLANGLKWNPGDRILLFRDEFPSNIYPFLNLQRLGVQIDYVESADGYTDIGQITGKLSPQTRILSVSFVKFYNGYRNDLQAIGELCRAHNIIFSVDGIQGVGALELDVEATKIDFLSNGGHKWMMGPLGCGFFYVSDRILNVLHPAFAGWLSVKDSWNFFDYNLDFLENASRFEIGTANAMGIVGAAAATDLLVEVTPGKIQEHLISMGEYIIDRLHALDFHFTGSDQKQFRSGIYAFRYTHAADLFQYLAENRISVSLREGAIRISPHFYNIKSDLDYFCQVCEQFVHTAGRGHEK